MEDQTGAQIAPTRLKDLIASPFHTLLVVAAGALNAYRSMVTAGQGRAGIGPGRPSMYVRTIVIEILFLGLVVIGVRLRGASLQNLFGRRWTSIGQMARDIGLGLLLLVSSTALVSIIGGHPHGARPDQGISYLIPQTSAELILWLALSVVAGICEEAIFRGYLQVQFTAITRSVPAGILFSAVAFGGAHAYQGTGRAVVIGFSALLYGVFAHWRSTVRPGMIAHSLQDAIAPALLKLVRH